MRGRAVSPAYRWVAGLAAVLAGAGLAGIEVLPTRTIYRFVDGRIAEVREYTDTDYAYGVWGEFDKSALGH